MVTKSDTSAVMTRDEFWTIDAGDVLLVTFRGDRVPVLVTERPQFPNGPDSDWAYALSLVERPCRVKFKRETTSFVSRPPRRPPPAS